MADNEVKDLADTPEILVDGYQGVSVTNAVARVNFYRSVFDPAADKVTKYGAVILALSPMTLVQVARSLNRVVDDFEAKGLLKVEVEEKK